MCLGDSSTNVMLTTYILGIDRQQCSHYLQYKPVVIWLSWLALLHLIQGVGDISS